MASPSLLSALTHILQCESVIIPFVYQLEAASNTERSSTQAVPGTITLTFLTFSGWASVRMNGETGVQGHGGGGNRVINTNTAT